MDAAVERMLMLAKSKGLNQRKFAEMLGIRPQAITEWRNGTTSSYTKRLPQIAELLNTTPNHILYGTTEKPTTETGDGPSESELIFKSLPPEKQEEALRYMRYLAENGDK